MTVSNNICPICNEGHLQACIVKNQVEYKGQTTELDMQYSVCDACCSEQANEVQMRANKRAMMAFRKQTDGLLTGAEVRVLRQRLSISQVEAAKVFGGGPVAFSKYESDDVAQSEAMDKLLRLASEVPEAYIHLISVAGIRRLAHADVVDGIESLASFKEQWIKAGIAQPQEPRPNLRVISSSKLTSEDGWRKSA